MPGRAVLAAAALACGMAGCGGSGSGYANELRPATPINVTAAIVDGAISLSPAAFGAGPIVMIVSNQTRERRTVTVETQELGGSRPGLTESTRPVAPGATSRLQADLREGSYEVSASGGGVSPVTLEVGAPRESAQDELLRP